LKEYEKRNPMKPLLTGINVKLGKILGRLAYALDPRYKRIVKRNLHFAYPNMSHDKINHLARKVYQQFGLTLIELLRLFFLSREELLDMVKVHGETHLEKVLKDGRGFIFFSAHIGNWEIAHIFISVFIDTGLVLVAKALHPSAIDGFINRLRSKFGNRIIYKKGALHHMARALRNKMGVGLLIDQETMTPESVEVTFFNKTANATPSVALLARRYDCPVLPVFCVREENTGRLLLVFRPPIDLVKTKDARSDIQTNTQKMTDEVEKIVRSYPSQWFWFHMRWKRHYPHLYPEDIARNERRELRKRSGFKGR
jgi:Kdo2-lipid IVA lauroyltransferase/acyltransferase